MHIYYLYLKIFYRFFTCSWWWSCKGQYNIIVKRCNVKFIKFIPDDLVTCPYIALVCIGTHNYPPPAPNRTPAEIRDNLQSMVMEAIGSNDSTTARSLLAGKYDSSKKNSKNS